MLAVCGSLSAAFPICSRRADGNWYVKGRMVAPCGVEDGVVPMLGGTGGVGCVVRLVLIERETISKQTSETQVCGIEILLCGHCMTCGKNKSVN